MRAKLWTRGAVAIGAACVLAATFLPWGTANPFSGRPRGAVVGVNINNTAPFGGPFVGDFLRGGPFLRGADAWRVTTLLAPALVVAALISILVALTPLRRARAAVAIAVLAVLAIAAVTIVTWINPPGFTLGPLRAHRPGAGEPLALLGAVVLSGALGLIVFVDDPS